MLIPRSEFAGHKDHILNKNISLIKVMKAFVFHQFHEGPKVIFEERFEKEVPDGYACVKILAASLNHRGDNYIMGSDVEEVKDKKYDYLVGKQVIIYPLLGFGDILGGPNDGTFCEKIIVPAENLIAKPYHLTPEQAAAIPVAGSTSYQALIVRGGLRAGETVLITGSGGGCGLFLIQFAKAFGANVFFTTGQKYKQNFIEDKFNVKGVLYTEENWSDKLKQIVPKEKGGFFDLIVDSSGGKFVPTYLDILKRSGRYVFFGQTLGPPSNEILKNWSTIYVKCLSIMGSDLCNFTDFKSMINFIIDHKIVPSIDSVVPFDQIMDQFIKMERREQIGKLVVSFAK
ncbi:4350_t:CDS:2 [Scutellospora calospora]|uniref:4350_t:CDS:1 n=1 Tax=Scutellospora calospora TaxID=85575 RepID=A0ACA9K0I3_9GLOM|nr:4350_t:CDS:2 [Scutellospora calospora]